MSSDTRTTKDAVRARLTVRSYRDSSTVYASRIYQCGLSIQEEARSVRVVLDKVAAVVARAMKAGKWECQG